jgi:hypothetical protein
MLVVSVVSADRVVCISFCLMSTVILEFHIQGVVLEL